MHMCILLFTLLDLPFVVFPSVLWYCWLGLLTCKNCLPYNLYCVGGDVKHCSIQSIWHISAIFVVSCRWLYLRRPVVTLWMDPFHIENDVWKDVISRILYKIDIITSGGGYVIHPGYSRPGYSHPGYVSRPGYSRPGGRKLVPWFQ